MPDILLLENDRNTKKNRQTRRSIKFSGQTAGAGGKDMETEILMLFEGSFTYSRSGVLRPVRVQ